MSQHRIDAAVRNNVAWCDAVCRANGARGEVHDAAWVNVHATPVYYPNLITLSDDEAAMPLIEGLLESDLPGGWGVKDSYASLDLAHRGFSQLFEGTWLWRDPMGDGEKLAPADSPWQRVANPRELVDWESAWSLDSPTEAGSRTFRDALLNDPEIAFLSFRSAGRIVAGLIANRSGDVVGVSNLFRAPDVSDGAMQAGIALVGELFPTLPLVGYEPISEAALGLSLGFERIQTLRVWLRQARGSDLIEK